MKKFAKLTVLSLLIIFSFSTISMATTVTIKYIDAIDKVQKNTNKGNFYTGLLKTTVNGTIWNTYCLDPFHSISAGKTWNAEYYNPSQIIAGNGNLYSNPVGVNSNITLEKYRMMGYLYNFGQSLTTKEDRGNLNLTFWEIAYDYDGNINSLNLDNDGRNFYLKSGSYGQAETWLANAFAQKDNNAFLPHLYTPVPVNTGQEFFAPVPEPGTLLLLGSGMLGLGIFGMIRRRKNA